MAAALFLAGIVCGYRLGLWPAAIGGTAICVLFLLGWRGGAVTRAAIVTALFFFLGWSDAAWNDGGRLREAERVKEVSKRQTFVCRVGPEVKVTPMRGKAAKFTFRAEHLRSADGKRMFYYLPVEVNWFGSRQAELTHAPKPGEVWRLTGRANVKRGRDGRLSLTVNTGEERAVKLTAADLGTWLVRIHRARQQAARRVAIGIETWGDIPVLNQAMLLGNRHVMPPALRRVFVDSGTIHVYSISGLHIVLVAAVLSLAVSACGIPRTYWVLVSGPLLIFYTALTGARPPAVRACLMALLYLVAPLIGRRPNALMALAGAALIVHAIQPWLIFDIGCVLSFTVMGGLVAFCQPFCRTGQRLFRVARLTERANLARAAGAKMYAHRLNMLAHAVTWLSNSLAVSLAAWVASLPLTAHYFGRFTPGGLFANLVVGPCSFFIVVSGCLGVLASTVSEWVAGCFNNAAGFFTWLMVKSAQITVAFPGANLRIKPWPLWLVWLWFSVLLVLAVWLNTRRRRPDGLAWLTDTQW